MIDRLFTMEEVRTAYPNPVSTSDYDGGDCYCVGAALLRFLGSKPSFGNDPWKMPHIHTMAFRFVQLLGLHYPVAYEAACKITNHNDRGRFREAWEEVDRLLKDFAQRHPELGVQCDEPCYVLVKGDQ